MGGSGSCSLGAATAGAVSAKGVKRPSEKPSRSPRPIWANKPSQGSQAARQPGSQVFTAQTQLTQATIQKKGFATLRVRMVCCSPVPPTQRIDVGGWRQLGFHSPEFGYPFAAGKKEFFRCDFGSLHPAFFGERQWGMKIQPPCRRFGQCRWLGSKPGRQGRQGKVPLSCWLLLQTGLERGLQTRCIIHRLGKKLQFQRNAILRTITHALDATPGPMPERGSFNPCFFLGAFDDGLKHGKRMRLPRFAHGFQFDAASKPAKLGGVSTNRSGVCFSLHGGCAKWRKVRQSGWCNRTWGPCHRQVSPSGRIGCDVRR